MSDKYMEARQEKLLQLVVENHIATAEPIGSRFLVEHAGLDWSEATVRNELRLLEEDGFLTHPHTSAGRVPTVAGFKYYVEHLNLEKTEVTSKEALEFKKALSSASNREVAVKNVGKILVELSRETVLIAFSPEKIYYTGLSNLFSKPDFAHVQLVANVSEVFDRCEDLLPDFFEKVTNEPQYYIGGEHPFGEMLSVLSTRFDKGNSLIALLGPRRMDYRHNWGLMKKAAELL